MFSRLPLYTGMRRALLGRGFIYLSKVFAVVFGVRVQSAVVNFSGVVYER